MPPFWASELAESFWEKAGEPEPFPRDLRSAIARALPVALVSLPGLRIATAAEWLARQGVPRALGTGDRALRAGLVARYGHGVIFIDGTDPPDEQRFSVAHELAHFLRDYWQPRQTTAERLGQRALEVLDGDRPPRPDERIQALLAGARLGFHTHLMERTPEGHFTGSATERTERDADLLAFELLAPAEAILAEPLPETFGERAPSIAGRLIATYGLPLSQAPRYARLLAPAPRPEASPLLRRLGFATSDE